MAGGQVSQDTRLFKVKVYGKWHYATGLEVLLAKYPIEEAVPVRPLSVRLGESVASAGNPVGPRSDGCGGPPGPGVKAVAAEGGTPEGRSLVHREGDRSKLTAADSMGPARATSDEANHEIQTALQLDHSQAVRSLVAAPALPSARSGLIDCGICGRDISSCTCDYGV